MKRRQYGTGSLIKIGSCRFWYAVFYINGRQLRVSTRTESKMEAEAVLRRLLSDRDRGLTPAQDLKKIRYGDLRRMLLGDYAMSGNKSLQTLANGEETIWGLKALDAFFGYAEPDRPGVPATQINKEAAFAFARQRMAEGLSNATVNRSLAILRRMLHLAFEGGLLPVVPKIKMLKEPPAREGFLAREDFERLLVALPDTLKPLVTFLYYCGVRLGEALQITWPQIDLDAALVRLAEDQTKTGKPRTVPLPDVLVGMLRAAPKEGMVFCSRNLRKAWAVACVDAGLGDLTDVEGSDRPRYTGLIIHDLRRSAIRNLIRAGVPESVCMAISGHKTRTVFDRYDIVNAEDKSRAMLAVERAANNVEKILKMLPARKERVRSKV